MGFGTEILFMLMLGLLVLGNDWVPDLKTHSRGSNLLTFVDEVPQAFRIVIDRTRLSGNFDVKLAWTPAPGEYSASGTFDHGDPGIAEATSIFTALPEQLGLKLEATRGPVDVLVIDRVDRPTAD